MEAGGCHLPLRKNSRKNLREFMFVIKISYGSTYQGLMKPPL